jgi:hypothetical protein
MACPSRDRHAKGWPKPFLFLCTPRLLILSHQPVKNYPNSLCGVRCSCLRFGIVVASLSVLKDLNATSNSARKRGFFQRVTMPEVLNGVAKCSILIRGRCIGWSEDLNGRLTLHTARQGHSFCDRRRSGGTDFLGMIE